VPTINNNVTFQLKAIMTPRQPDMIAEVFSTGEIGVSMRKEITLKGYFRLAGKHHSVFAKTCGVRLNYNITYVCYVTTVGT
jgi:hypothetical protein